MKEDANKSIGAPPIEIAEGESLVQVDSNVGSIAMSTLPPFPHVPHLKAPVGGEKIADLESPSLSDTQVRDIRPRPPTNYPSDGRKRGIISIESEPIG